MDTHGFPLPAAAGTTLQTGLAGLTAPTVVPRALKTALESPAQGRREPDGGRLEHDSEPACGPVLYPFADGGEPHLFVFRWRTWPLPPAGPLEFVCEWLTFGIAESRAGIDGAVVTTYMPRNSGNT